MPIDRTFCIDTLAKLVQTNSVNPILIPDAPGERGVADVVVAALGGLGLEIERHEPQPGRVSVTARLKGSGGGKSLMLNGHYDTVGIDGMPEPLSGAVRDGKLYGRGSFDMKGAVAACMTAVRSLAQSGERLRGDVVVAAVADEEYGSLGTADLVAKMKVDGAVVTEPTALQICLAHKGYIWIEVETLGRAYHGSKFEFGVDANMRMGWFLAELDRLERDLRARPPHPLIGPPSLHAATLEGGTGLSTYSPSCKLEIERRTIPGETEATVMAEIQSIIDRLTARDPSFRATAKAFFVRSPFEVAPSAAIVKALDAAAVAVSGNHPRQMGDTPWMDSALLADAGVETVVFGPTGSGAHSDEEWVDVESVCVCAEVLAETARRYCA
ncbi:MAG: ArgE/DapE family deacylase [Gemmatimonadota bacterium]